MEAVRRPALDDMGLNLRKQVRLHRLLHNQGLRNGTLMVLPIRKMWQRPVEEALAMTRRIQDALLQHFPDGGS